MSGALDTRYRENAALPERSQRTAVITVSTARYRGLGTRLSPVALSPRTGDARTSAAVIPEFHGMYIDNSH